MPNRIQTFHPQNGSPRYIKAVVFDLDGLMIDSEPLSLNAWQKLLAEYDCKLTQEDFQAIIGLESDSSAREVKKRTDIPLDVIEIIERHDQLRLQIIREEAVPAEGLRALVHTLQQSELSLAVASNSPTEYVIAALETIAMDEHFECVIGADQVAFGKPAPHIYLAAAATLQVDPQHCLVIEDSPTGMQAAISAGMRCAVIPNNDLADEDFSGAFARFSSIPQLMENIDALIRL